MLFIVPSYMLQLFNATYISLQNIRLFNGCEVQIENSFTSVNVHHGDAEHLFQSNWIFDLHQTTIEDSFILHTITF